VASGYTIPPQRSPLSRLRERGRGEGARTICSIALTTLVAALWVPPVCAAPRALDRIVAVVNEEVISSVELDRRVNAAEAQLKRQNITLPASEVLRKQVLDG